MLQKNQSPEKSRLPSAHSSPRLELGFYPGFGALAIDNDYWSNTPDWWSSNSENVVLKINQETWLISPCCSNPTTWEWVSLVDSGPSRKAKESVMCVFISLPFPFSGTLLHFTAFYLNKTFLFLKLFFPFFTYLVINALYIQNLWKILKTNHLTIEKLDNVLVCTFLVLFIVCVHVYVCIYVYITTLSPKCGTKFFIKKYTMNTLLSFNS